MLRWTSAVVLLTASIASAQPAAAPVAVQPCGVSVLDPAAVAGFEQGVGVGEPGTTVTLLLKAGGNAGIVGIENHDSTVSAFADDKGKDLSKPPAAPKKDDEGFTFMPEGARVGSFPAISADRKAALLTVTTPVAPSPGAAKVSVKATLKVLMAAGKEPVEVKNVALAKGDLAAPGHHLSISDTSEAQNFEGNAEFIVSIQAQGETATRLESVEFLDAAGKPIDASRRGWMSGGDTTVFDYALSKKIDKATLRFQLWKDLKTLDVPVDVSATLGVASK